MVSQNNSRVSGRKLTYADLEKIWKSFDLVSYYRRVDEAIAPQIEAYRVARARSYAEGRHHVFI